MANNVSKKGMKIINGKQSYVWTECQQNWLELAKAGNERACGKLFTSMKGLLESVHRYSQDGKHPSNFGYDYNFSGRTFEEAASDIYTAFKRGVEKFESSLDVPFGAYIVGEIRRRAMDWTRDRQTDHHVVVGQRLDSGAGDETHVMSQADYESYVNSYYAERSNCLSDMESHPVESCEISDLVAKIRCEVLASGDQRLVDFVAYYLEYAGEKGVMDMIAERMNVTRAMAYVYLDKVRALIMPKFGEELGAAA